MWTLSDRLRPLSLRAAAVVFAIALPGAFQALPAGAAPQGTSATTPESRQELRRSLEALYEVLPVRNGVVLKPHQERLGVRTVEVTGDTIAINGERVSAGVLRAWLGEDAEAILRLQALPEAERRELFGIEGPGETPEPEEATPQATTGEVEIPSDDEVAEAPEPPELPEPPEVPEPPDSRDTRRGSGSRVNILGGVTVEKDELAEEVVAVGGSVRVDGEVERDVVAVGGSVRIKGRVGGSVVGVGGGVYLEDGAVVEGDVSSVGGTIHRGTGTRIEGQSSEVGFVPFISSRRRDWDGDFGPWAFWGGGMNAVEEVIGLVFLALLVCLVVLVARRPLERVDRQLVAEPWKAGLVGFLAQLLFLPLLVVVTVLLAITVVGCALFLLYPFLFLGLILLAFLGYAAVAHRVGRWVEGRFGRGYGSPFAAALIGVLVIQIWSVIGSVLGMGGGVLDFFSGMFLLLGWAVTYVAWTVGFGAVLLARFGTEPGYWPRRASTVGGPPPVPPSAVPVGAQPVEHLPLSESLESPPAPQDWDDPDRDPRWEGEPR
ncbi:MAG TPA: hypothetical protein VLQ45_00615 [Thermoanaerobaculia bacterium]|nr:hypothetical protein [Thermoanaerobaculia bacterium]